MRKLSFLLCVLSVIGLYSCSQEEAFIEGTASKGLTAQIPAYQFESETRIGISENLHSFTWSDGDQIGICYTSGTTYADARFMLTQGGSNHGEFVNEAFSLKPNSAYFAFYPYLAGVTIDAYPVDFTGQKQTKNGGTSHLGARNYMSANVNTDEDGSADITFQNLASVIQIDLPIQETGIYTSVTVTSTGNDFILRGTLDMNNGKFNALEKGQKMELSLGTGIAINQGDMFTANILVAPTDLSGKELKIVLANKYGENLITYITGKSIQAGKAYKLEGGSMNEIPYLTFTAESEQRLRMSKAVETLEYSVNNGEWKELGTNLIIFGGTNGNLRMRGKSAIGTATSYSDYSQIITWLNPEIYCYGDIRTLVDYENYKTADTSEARFTNLFRECFQLKSAPSLPATTLASYCYKSMFEGCTSLESTPELPASIIAEHCYEYMFKDCTSLTTAPELHAPILAEHCYNGMFKGCTNLATAPELPATTLAEHCYEYMFSGCTSLVSAPELHVETLTEFCYYSMFEGCTSLTTAPVLPATSLAISCYNGMFRDCTSLTIAPVLSASKLTPSCYMGMFMGCSNLNYIKMLATDISESVCLYDWTKDVSSTGTFIKSKDATWSDEEVVPTGWTVKTDAPAI